MEMLNFWVDIENSAGDKLGAGPLRPKWYERDKPLSESGDFRFPVSPADPNFGVIAKLRYAMVRYLDQDGAIQDFAGGIIKQIEKTSSQTKGTEIIISGPALSGELNHRSVRSLQVGSALGGVTTAPTLIMALAPPGWSIVSGATDEDVYMGFDGQSVLNALCTISEGIAEHWRLGTGRQIIWLGPYADFSSSGVRAIAGVPQSSEAYGKEEIAIIRRVQEIEDSHEVINRIYPRGSGNGHAIMKFLSLTETPPTGYTASISGEYIQITGTAAADVIEKEIDFKGISPLSNTTGDKRNAANQLMRAAVEYLRRYGSAPKFYNVELVKVDQALEPGTTIRVEYQDVVNENTVLDIDEDLNIVKVTERISHAGISTTKIQVSTIDAMAMSDNDFVISTIQSQKLFTTHAQMNANARWLRTQGLLDDSHDLDIPLFFEDVVTNINRVTLRFKINRLRSTVKAVATGGSSTPTSSSGGGSEPTSSSGGSSEPTSSSGGGETPTSSSGGSETPTTASGGGETLDGGSHQHPTLILGSYAGATLIGAKFYALSGIGKFVSDNGSSYVTYTGYSDNHNHDVSDHTHTVAISAHTHTVEVDDHTHTVAISAHTHTVEIDDHTHTVAISAHTHAMEYGIFEETAGNTLSLANMTIKVNAGLDLSGSVTGPSNGWYTLDITADLIDDELSPIAEANEIVFATGTANKTASILADISTSEVIQAVSSIAA